jgi:hypothetical protein
VVWCTLTDVWSDGGVTTVISGTGNKESPKCRVGSVRGANTRHCNGHRGEVKLSWTPYRFSCLSPESSVSITTTPVLVTEESGFASRQRLAPGPYPAVMRSGRDTALSVKKPYLHAHTCSRMGGTEHRDKP